MRDSSVTNLGTAGILRSITILEGGNVVVTPLGVDDYLIARPLEEGELEYVLFKPHAWLRRTFPDWFGNIAPTDQVTLIFSYPDLPPLDTVRPYVEVLKERPLITVRCPPASAMIQKMRSELKEEPAGVLDLVLYKEARLAYGHYEISKDQDVIEKTIRAIVADPQSYINAIGAANTNPNIKFQAVERISEMRFICQLKPSPSLRLDDTPELPACTMFTANYVPDDTDPDTGTATVDTIWAADWPAPNPPQPDPPTPDPPQPDPPQPDPPADPPVDPS